MNAVAASYNGIKYDFFYSFMLFHSSVLFLLTTNAIFYYGSNQAYTNSCNILLECIVFTLIQQD